MRLCIGACGRSLDPTAFRRSRSGGLRNVCRQCEGRQKSVEGRKKSDLASGLCQKRRRQNDPAWAVLTDSKGSDRKAKREHDLTYDLVKSLLGMACSYCGESGLRMTLDRIDNSLGHLQSNVVPACVRCNYSRGTMPYEAWLFLVPGLREARESGSFGDWVGRTYKNNTPS
jgi:hypothetical protein